MKSRGFTLFEFAVCMSLCALMVGSLLMRLAEYQRESDRVAAHTLVGAMRTAMAVRSAQLKGAGDAAGVAALRQENPFHFLAQLPKNYQGEYYRPRAGLVEEGNWYFDPSDRTVNYVQYRDTFSTEIPKLLNFNVELFREPDPSSNDERREAARGIMLSQTNGKAAPLDH